MTRVGYISVFYRLREVTKQKDSFNFVTGKGREGSLTPDSAAVCFGGGFRVR